MLVSCENALYAVICTSSCNAVQKLFLCFTSEKLMDLRNEYLEADEATKRFLEQRYGKRVIQKALEEMESKEWLEKNSKSCPCCSTPIEVSGGGGGEAGITVTPDGNECKRQSHSVFASAQRFTPSV